MQLLRLSDVQTMTQLSRSYIYKLISNQGFPSPKKIGASSFWIGDEIEEWLATTWMREIKKC
jgi:predicted DNA-binding transcriptional regulator AlpA